ncbi:MAG: deoxyribonuclease V [Bacteroidota bacterium]
MNDHQVYFQLQKQLSQRVITSNHFDAVTHIAGADVAYSDATDQMIGAIVVLDAQTLEVVDQAVVKMEITFPYVPGLFSFREVPPLLKAFELLSIKPDLIVCDGHGIAHPRGLGMASHLGLELDLPTIGCAKKRLIGDYEEVGQHRGAYSSLQYEGEEVGRVLRTQDGIKPLFVSVGHKVSIDTACHWILQLAQQYRQAETTRKADALVRAVMARK